MGDRLTVIQSSFPELREKYDLLSVMGVKKGSGVSNIKLYEKTLDSDSVNLFNENMRELSNPNTIKINTSYENKKEIAEFFSSLPYFSVLQSGFDTNSELSLQRIMPNNVFVENMSRIIKEYSDKTGTHFSRELLTDFFNRYININMFRYNKRAGKFKNYATDKIKKNAHTITFIDRSDEIEEDDGAVTITESITGTQTFTLDPMSHKETLEEYLERINLDPNKIYIFNDIVSDNEADTAKALKSTILRDKVFKHLEGLDNVVGIPTRNSYSGSPATDPIKDGNTKQFKEFKSKLDKAIKKIKALKAKGKTPVFYTKGYGSMLIGIKDTGGNFQSSTGLDAFEYLSEQLFKEFNYKNPHYENLSEDALDVFSSKQTITNQDVLDKIRICFE